MKAKFLEALSALGHRCKYELSLMDFEIYAEVFEKHGFDVGFDAVKKALVNTKSGDKMPSPADLLGFVGKKELSNRDQGVDIAGRIMHAMSKFGGYQEEKARSFLGPQAWEVVLRSGGWWNLCMSEIDNANILTAQLRDSAAAVTQLPSNSRSSLFGPEETHTTKFLDDLFKDAGQLKQVWPVKTDK